MPEVIQLGPLNLQSGMLALILAFAASLLLIKLHLRHTTWVSAPITEMLVNSGIIVLLTWKFGVVLTSPSLLLSHPLKLLMLTGTQTEAIVGAILALIYFCTQISKHQLPLRFMLDLVAYGGIAASIVYNALAVQYGKPTALPWGIGVEGTQALFHPVNLYSALLLLPFLIYLLITRQTAGDGKIFRISAMYYGCAGMLATFFSITEPTLLYLSPLQLLYLAMILVGMLLPNFTHNRDRKELIELAKNDSKEQIKQEQEDKSRQGNSMDTNGDGNFDKKLDGPNRPAE